MFPSILVCIICLLTAVLIVHERHSWEKDDCRYGKTPSWRAKGDSISSCTKKAEERMGAEAASRWGVYLQVVMI